jgi:hypothetical protein
MSEAPRARISHTAAPLAMRAFLLVLGTIALLLFVAPQAAHALDLGSGDGVVDQVAEPVDGAVDQVAEPVDGAVDQVAEPVDGAVDQVAEPVDGAVDQVAEPVEGAVDQVAEPVDQLVGQVGGVVDQVVEPVDQLVGQVEGVVDEVAEPVTEPPWSPPEDQIEPEVLGGRDQTEPSTSTEKAGPSVLAGQTPAPAGPVLTESSLSEPTGASNADFPTGSPWIPVGSSSASIGGLETGGHGLPFNAGFLASALLLVVAMSRWLRFLHDARAPNPFLSRVEVPG